MKRSLLDENLTEDEFIFKLLFEVLDNALNFGLKYY